MSFAGKIVWITGASSGIGEALAYALAAQGARLILSARREAKLRTVQAACAHPDRHVVLTLDLADTASLESAAHQALDRADPVDVLINNGGVSQRARALDTQLAVDRRIMDVNYFGAVALTKAVLPSMLTCGAGHLVVVTSVVGKEAWAVVLKRFWPGLFNRVIRKAKVT